MGFLNQSILQKKAAMAAVEKHPLLKECDVPLNVRQTYLQGCVLAVLERDDGKVTETARQEIAELGFSLEMSNEDIKEAISVVSSLSSPEAQDEFLGELFVALSGEVYPRYFLKDFEGLLTKGGSVSANMQKTLDYFGSSLTGKKDWRSAVVIKNTEREHDVVPVLKIEEQPNDVIRNYLEEIPFHLDPPDGSPTERIGNACRVYSPDAMSVFVELLRKDPSLCDVIENAAKREAVIRNYKSWNRYVFSEEVVRKFHQVMKDAIPGLKAYINGPVVRWVLPDTEYRKRMMRLPCGYDMRRDELGNAIRDVFAAPEDISFGSTPKLVENRL